MTEAEKMPAADAARGLSEGLGPLPLWRDDAGRSWWGADELTGAHLLAWCDAAVAAERERCAKLCETWMEAAERESGPEAAGWLHQMAQHMRNLRA